MFLRSIFRGVTVGLNNLLTSGAQLTRSNRRIGSDTTEKRLDRALFNEDWINALNHSTCCTLPRVASDHHPLLLFANSQVHPRHSPFKFHKMWLLNSDCRRLVADVWRIEVVGCPMFILSQKLRNLKKELKDWNHNVFGNIHQRVNSAKANVDVIQNCINDQGPDISLLEQEDLAQTELMNALVVEESFWKEKAKINWYIMSDKNTSFFHRVTKIKQGTKSLSMLKYGDSVLTNHDDIANHVLDYYTNLFASPNITAPNSVIQDVIPRLVTDEGNSMLTQLPSITEIKDAVFALNGEAAPSPDGFSGCFFQKIWDIIKTEGADRVEDCRPIALANFQFKIITKVLSNRLDTIAPKILSNQQRGFIKDRQIKDCICLASEAINMMDHKNFWSNLAIKLDIKNAFDTIDWTFLLDTLHIFGFNYKFIQWIKVILQYAKLSINVNGNSVGFFKGSLPFNYLGVPLFKGKPRRIHLQRIADRILAKLVTGKGSSLSIMGRVELVRSIIHSMLVNSFHIYKWPTSLLDCVDKGIRNFI
ncbi:PREDICTED: uncharacterized protein LOC109341364 [Lupinus angustifolius]|uniref:uncharacterized protein LOC109341364 n=1 Tax=Lupinus angustifolius TaxID=3871 RepID=UPI00092EFA69|nr:PREDICTED: uncharacterized protein LOC109341364 [Lupinus angustifolius]